MRLFFDTETVGMINRKVKDKPQFQPDIVQLAAVLEDKNRRILGAMSVLIAEVKVADSSKYHGITQEMVDEYGIPRVTALDMFGYFLARSELIIAHNIEFDEIVMKSEIARSDLELRKVNGSGAEAFNWPTLYCTKEASSPILDIPPTERMIKAGFNKPKPPTLAEAYLFFTGNPIKDAHDALADVYACRAVYHAIQDRSC